MAILSYVCRVIGMLRSASLIKRFICNKVVLSEVTFVYFANYSCYNKSVSNRHGVLIVMSKSINSTAIHRPGRNRICIQSRYFILVNVIGIKGAGMVEQPLSKHKTTFTGYATIS